MINCCALQIILCGSRARALLVGLLLAAQASSWAAAQTQPRTPRATPSGRRGAAPREPEAREIAGARPVLATPRSITFTLEREAAALAFVRANGPELLPVLEDLKVRKQADYERAICDFFWTSETLAAIRQEDPGRYAVALRSWQLEARTHLLASQLAAQPSDAEKLRSELEQAVQQLVAAQIETSAYDLHRQEAQLRRAQERHQKLEAQRDELVRQRLAALSQAIDQLGAGQVDRP